MIIRISKNNIQQKELLKLIVPSYFCGVGVLLAVPMVLAMLVIPFRGDEKEIIEITSAVVLIPIVLLLQGIFFSLIIGLGLWILRKIKPVEFEWIEESDKQ